MGRQLDQLPTDTTTLARKVASLEREVQELRASRRLASATAGLIQTSASGARLELDGTTQALSLYAADGETVLARMAPDTVDGGGGMWTRGLQEPLNLSAFLAGGELRFRPVADGVIDEDSTLVYSTDGLTYADLILSSGAVLPSDPRAVVLLESAVSGQPVVYVTGDGANTSDMFIDGVFSAGNMAWGTVSITPSAANTPTALAVTGLALEGTAFFGLATANTTVPGTQVTGVGVTGVTSTGMTIWVTRTNTSSTGVNWMVVGK